MSSDEDKKSVPEPAPGSEPGAEPKPSTYTPTVEDPYGYYDDPYAYDAAAGSTPAASTTPPAASTALAAPPASPPPPAPPSPPVTEPEDEEEESMLRMSFLEHLQELRSRIFYMLAGIGVAFILSLVFAERLWLIVSEPAVSALTQLGLKDPRLAQITPMEVFNTVWVKLPMLAAIFLASPWILYQVWAFIAPGLYKKERRWAAPFVLCSAGLFIIGGLFAYFVAFRFGLTFLLGIGRDIRIQPVVSVTEYFDLFVNVTLGVGLVFELPVLIFFLTLLRLASPRFLLSNSRYAILIIVILAAIITPTPDVFNLMLFAVPMVMLYFLGLFASYLLVLNREGGKFPWRAVGWWTLAVLALAAFGIAIAVSRYGYHFAMRWPFLVR